MSRFLSFLATMMPKNLSVGTVMAVDMDALTTRVMIGQHKIIEEFSCVAYRPQLNQVVAIGKKAFKLQGKTNLNLQVIFPFAQGKIKNLLLFKFLILGFIDRLISLLPHHFLQYKVIWATGSNCNQIHQDKIKQLLQSHGAVNQVIFQDKLTAVFHSLASQHKISTEGCIIWVGEAQTEIGIFSNQELIKTDQIAVGVENWLKIIIDQVRMIHKIDVGLNTAKNIWQETAAINQKAPLTTVVRGKQVLTFLPITASISSQDYESQLLVDCQKIATQLRRLFSMIAPELSAQIIETGIVLTGPGSRIRGIGDFFADFLRCPVEISLTPDTDVINGLRLEK